MAHPPSQRSFKSSATTGALLALSAAFALSACMSSGRTLRPLTPVPTTAVTATQLPQPIVTSQNTPFETQTLDQAAGIDGTIGTAPLDGSVETATLPSDPTASVQPPASATGQAVSEDALIGVWSASTASATCSLNLSLTSWQGGFRASTRNCADPQMATLGAWSVDGQQVMLKAVDGSTLARLFQTGPTRYAGQFETGGPVTVFR